jgi:hypothetical protein
LKALAVIIALSLSLSVSAQQPHDPLQLNARVPNLPDLGAPDKNGSMFLVVPPSCARKHDTSEACRQRFQNRLEIRDAKRFMPEINGFKPERLTIRRNSLNFSYSW